MWRDQFEGQSFIVRLLSLPRLVRVSPLKLHFRVEIGKAQGGTSPTPRTYKITGAICRSVAKGTAVPPRVEKVKAWRLELVLNAASNE